MNDQDKKVADYLQAAGVTFAAALVGETDRGDNGKAWICDEWKTQFERRAQSGGVVEKMAHPFYTGTGHRAAKVKMPKSVAVSPRSIAAEQWRAQNVRPVAPTAAGVLYCLLSDARSADQNLHDWCADMSLDPDSRKACATYDACCLILADVRRFFTREERAALDDILQDY